MVIGELMVVGVAGVAGVEGRDNNKKGRIAAIGQFGKLNVTGRLALTLWGLVHIFLLIGFQNRALVMIQWIWSYLTYQRGVRLITRPWPFLAPGATQTP